MVCSLLRLLRGSYSRYPGRLLRRSASHISTSSSTRVPVNRGELGAGIPTLVPGVNAVYPGYPGYAGTPECHIFREVADFCHNFKFARSW
eukprot:1986590-Rhodomonas_salina.1